MHQSSFTSARNKRVVFSSWTFPLTSCFCVFVQVWDGLWLHCILQSTGQMQCKTHTTPTTMTSDIQAGRPLTLLSILAGLLGFVVALLGGGVVNCSGSPSDPFEPPSSSRFRKKVLEF